LIRKIIRKNSSIPLWLESKSTDEIYNTNADTIRTLAICVHCHILNKYRTVANSTAFSYIAVKDSPRLRQDLFLKNLIIEGRIK
jgi:hypothetical protein